MSSLKSYKPRTKTTRYEVNHNKLYKLCFEAKENLKIRQKDKRSKTLNGLSEGKNYNPMKHCKRQLKIFKDYKTIDLKILIISCICISLCLLQNMHIYTV